MVQIIRKALLPNPSEVIEQLRPAATQAHSIVLREPRPAGFPLLFTANLLLIEPAVAYLHEHFVQRAHTADTLRTYCEILYDWFETLEQNAVDWAGADAVDLVAYRNRMLLQPSARTGRPYRISTVNLRVRGVLRFYEWAVRMRWLEASSLVGRPGDFGVARRSATGLRRCTQAIDHSLFVLRQFELLPRPLTSGQARELLATLPPPYDLMARWQLYTGLRVSELLRLSSKDVSGLHAVSGVTPHDRGDAQGAQARLRDRTVKPARRDGRLSQRPPPRLATARPAQGATFRAHGAVHQRPWRACRQERLSARDQPGRPEPAGSRRPRI